ncbi:Ankyrin repeat family protein [Quillaja saponaria]|uniref:Ankyrin repeat family protein n=1 Tax=Quillaja saponaria TaxID=32244 RepID=A0AAD7PDF4_QUISA|nr:Ankyrin repeat family protein [Quillaja saponaria]
MGNFSIWLIAPDITYKEQDELSKDRVNTLLLMSTLVAAITFAAGFAMPGGYNNSNPDQGLATMLYKHFFAVFLIYDCIAMYSSIIVAVASFGRS